MPIETITIDDMRAAAALMSRGFSLRGGRETQRPGIVEFDLLVDASRKAEVEDLLSRCDRQTARYDFEVHLGDYEKAWKRLRDLVNMFKTEIKETDEHGNGRHPAGGDARL